MNTFFTKVIVVFFGVSLLTTCIFVFRSGIFHVGTDEIRRKQDENFLASVRKKIFRVEEGASNANAIINRDGFFSYGNFFSFEYPRGSTVAQFPGERGEGETVLVQLDDDNAGLQIFLNRYDEEGGISVERIREDLPDLEMEDIRNAELAGAHGIYFRTNGGIQKEVWLVHEGFLYQISYLDTSSKFAEDIFKTWKFL